MVERATREWAMSPQIATFSPSIRPFSRRMVSVSSRPWVGCSCMPSPALITAQSTFRESNFTPPEALWRMTMTSGFMAFSVIAVSIRVSPFFTLEAATGMFTTSAPSRFAAISKLDMVRVEFSKKRLMTVLFFRSGAPRWPARASSA